jgi:hypothetical protein
MYTFGVLNWPLAHLHPFLFEPPVHSSPAESIFPIRQLSPSILLERLRRDQLCQWKTSGFAANENKSN